MRLEITTREMYDKLFASLRDAFYDDDNINVGDIIDAARALARGDMNGIRRAFKDGYTAMLLGEKMGTLEEMSISPSAPEILVRHKEQVIGVLVELEINY